LFGRESSGVMLGGSCIKKGRLLASLVPLLIEREENEIKNGDDEANGHA
jgi:hypothetical protein